MIKLNIENQLEACVNDIVLGEILVKASTLTDEERRILTIEAGKTCGW